MLCLQARKAPWYLPHARTAALPATSDASADRQELRHYWSFHLTTSHMVPVLISISPSLLAYVAHVGAGLSLGLYSLHHPGRSLANKREKAAQGLRFENARSQAVAGACKWL